MRKYLYRIRKFKIKPWIKYWILNKEKTSSGVLSEILTGTSFTLENSLDRLFNKFDLKGNTLQDGTPTPDSPIPIQNVSGSNTIKVQNKNFLPTDNINKSQAQLTVVSQESGSVLFNGTKYGGTFFNFTENIFSLNPGDYTFAIRKKSGSCSGTNTFNFINYDTNEIVFSKAIYMTYTTTEWKNDFLLNFTVNQKVNLYLQMAIPDYNVFTDFDMQMIIYKGTLNKDTIGDYIAHEGQNLPVNLMGKNLLDESTIKGGYVNILGQIETSGLQNQEGYTDFIYVSPNTTYIFKIFESSWSAFGTSNWIGVGEYNSKNISSFIQRDTMTTGSQDYIIFTTSATTNYIILSARGLNATTKKAQLQTGSTATDYEPYYNIKLHEGDYLADDGVHHVMGEVVFDGSDDENWSMYSSNANRTIFKILISNIEKYLDDSIKPNILSSHFTTVPQRGTWKPGDISTTTVDKSIFVAIQSGLTLTDFKTWLSTNNVKVQYKLAEEVIEPYPEPLQNLYNQLQTLKSYNNQTNISQTNSDLPFIIDLQYWMKEGV